MSAVSIVRARTLLVTSSRASGGGSAIGEIANVIACGRARGCLGPPRQHAGRALEVPLAPAFEHAVLVLEIGNEREHFERTFPELEVAWLETSAGNDQVLLITRQALAAAPALPARAR